MTIELEVWIVGMAWNLGMVLANGF